MLEWLAYHLSIGFTDFVIYTNDCEDGTDMLAKRLQRLGYISHMPNPVAEGQGPQRKALRRFRRHPLASEVDWMICMDVDEFINIRVGDGKLGDLFGAVGDVDAISFCWKLFGNSGRTAFEDEFVTRQFLWAVPENMFPTAQSRGLKTLFRNNGSFKRMAIHRPRVDPDAPMPKWVDAGGQAMPETYKSQGWSAHRAFSHQFARLHHYSVRSVESFLVKRQRGRTNHVGDDQGPMYWQQMNFNLEEDQSILQRLPAARAVFEEFMEDARLKRWHEQSCRWHQRRIRRLKRNPEWARFADMIALHGRASLLQGAYLHDLNGIMARQP